MLTAVRAKYRRLCQPRPLFTESEPRTQIISRVANHFAGVRSRNRLVLYLKLNVLHGASPLFLIPLLSPSIFEFLQYTDQ